MRRGGKQPTYRLRRFGDVADDVPGGLQSWTAITLTLISGQDQVARPGEPLAEPLVVQVTDDAGFGVSGIGIDWAITGGDGALESSFSPETRLPVGKRFTRTDDEGLARVPLMPLAFETLEVRAVADGYGSRVTFLVDATDPGASLSLVSGNDQPAQAGRQLEPFVLRLTDGHGEPVSYVRVVWSVENRDADFGFDRARSDTTRTDADGLARVSLTPTWFGPVEVSASVIGVSGSPLTFTAESGGDQHAQDLLARRSTGGQAVPGLPHQRRGDPSLPGR